MGAGVVDAAKVKEVAEEFEYGGTEEPACNGIQGNKDIRL